MTDPNEPLTPPGDSDPGPQPPSYPAQQPPYPQRFPTGYGSPYNSPYPSPYGPPPSTAMSSWALGLSFVICIPVAVLVSIGLAIAVLVRSTAGRDFGRKRAVIALVIDGVWVVGFVVLVVLSAIGVINLDDAKRDESGRVTETQTISINSLRVGDCFDQTDLREMTDEETEPVAEVIVKPCSELHDFEMFSEFELAAGDYPGEDAITAEANQKCFIALDEYAGTGPRARRASVAFIYPLALDWKLRRDHTVQCLLGFESGQTRGSLKKG